MADGLTAGVAVDWQWAGALTATGFQVKARLTGDATTRLAVATDPGFSQPVYSAAHQATANGDWVVAFTADGLRPDTAYFYTLEINGSLNLAGSGRLHTFPAGPASFDFVFAGDALGGSNASVFDSITALQPDFYLVVGDLFYADIASNDPLLYHAAYGNSLRQTRQANLYRAAPVAYAWDDHDYSTNNSDATSAARPAARQSYQDLAPHYPLAEGSGNVPIYQAFTVGRVRFLLTDLRSERSPDITADGAAKSMLGATQKAWLEQELLAANGLFPLIVWVSSVPWIGPVETGGDYWGGFSYERAELARFIEENNIQGLVILSGDAHMVALDDGSNNRYGPSGKAMFPVLHAAPLAQSGSVKGGPYSHGAYPAPTTADGQFARVQVQDNGSQVCLDFSGRRLPGGASQTIELIHWSRCFTAQVQFKGQQGMSFQAGAAPSPGYSGASDTVLAQAAGTQNYGASAVCGADGDNPPGTGQDQVTLLSWDLSSVPAQAAVRQAEIVLWVSNPTAESYPFYGLLRNWSEMQATWQIALQNDPWQLPGGEGAADRSSTLVGVLGPVQSGLRTSRLNPAGIQLVQNWINNPGSNHGLVLANASAIDGVDFNCREASGRWLRPRLNLTYWMPNTDLYLPVILNR